MISEAPPIAPSIRDLAGFADLCNALHGHFEEIIPLQMAKRYISLELWNGKRTAAAYVVELGKPTKIVLNHDVLPTNVIYACNYLLEDRPECDGFELLESSFLNTEQEKEIHLMVGFRELGERCQINSAKHSN